MSFSAGDMETIDYARYVILDLDFQNCPCEDESEHKFQASKVLMSPGLELDTIYL